MFLGQRKGRKGGVQDSTQARTGLGGAVQIGRCSFLQAAGTGSTEKVSGEACLGRSPVGSGSQTGRLLRWVSQKWVRTWRSNVETSGDL